MEKYMQNYEIAEEALMPVSMIVTEKVGIGFGSITSPEMTTAEAEAEAQEVAQFRIKIDWRNPAVCLDGRRAVVGEGYSSLPIGPHIAGGAETVLVAAKAAGYHLEGAELIASLKEKGFTLGAHVDSGNFDARFENGTGCGACDRCEGSCQLFADCQEDLAPTIQALMGSHYDEATYLNTVLSSVSEDKNFVRNLVGSDLTETLLDDGEGVHGHREQLIIFNYEDDTTIDRDAYFAATGKEVFIVYMWYIKRLADAMAAGVRATEQASQLYHAMVAFQVATYIGLCDGSHLAAIFQAQELATVA